MSLLEAPLLIANRQLISAPHRGKATLILMPVAGSPSIRPIDYFHFSLENRPDDTAIHSECCPVRR